MKKLINDPRQVVREMLEGLADLTPGLALLEGETVAVRADLPAPAERPVAVISGGGAGHEPAHAGYVGAGMLTAAVAGDVFTSPPVDAVLAAIRAAAGPRGAVLVVKNYTGDRLNFGLAAELARAEGCPVEIVTVADDVALRNTVPPARRRGIAGTVLVHKIAGAMAATGAPLDRVAAVARGAAEKVGTMGVALGPCTVPAVGKPGFTLGEDEIELGLGIHGEPGVRRGKIEPADALTDTMLDAILTDRGIVAGDHVALLVNNLGGTPPMELAIVARRAIATLRARGVAVARAWAGTFLSALEMPGCSLSLLKLDEATLPLLDAPTDAPAWGGAGRIPAERALRPAASGAGAEERNRSQDQSGPAVMAATRRAAAALLAAEGQLTQLDSAAGDGDLGASMARGAAAIETLRDAPPDAAGALTLIGGALRRAIAGSSGPFYAVGLLRAARHLASLGRVTPRDWADALDAGVRGITELGGATAGDRTMLDALLPAAEAFRAALEEGAGAPQAWSRAAAAAQAGAAATAQMAPRLGRASYLGARAVGHEDAGAAAVAIWMAALAGSPT
jgi:dihydroxyacetone kinase